ncbi:MAG: hypothetical protein QHH10_11945 [Peptococcaceae bacterium]|nr:hypothetical protein [Peptococcaceae bacterium]MDH7526015.1 hypothetical protein [Peptococcaceae bacterium]
MFEKDFKPLYLSYACKDLLKSSYTKSDIKSIDMFASSFPTHEAVDEERKRLSPDIDKVFSELRKCVNEHQMRRVLKSQPINIKFFMFERLAVISTFLDKSNVEGIKVDTSMPVGLAFVEAIEKMWQQIVDSMDNHNSSISQFSERFLSMY